MERKVADIVALECIHLEYYLLHLRILVVDDSEAILEIFSRIQILRQFECFFRDDDILHTVECIASDVICARTVSHHIPTLLESLYEIRMNIKFMILLCIEAIVGYGDDAVVTHCLDDVFQIVSARRHIFQEYTILELVTVANHGIEGEGIEHPASGTSFLKAVAIFYVIAVSAATADADFKQFLDGMEVVDEGTAREFRSIAEIRILPSALDFL